MKKPGDKSSWSGKEKNINVFDIDQEEDDDEEKKLIEEHRETFNAEDLSEAVSESQVSDFVFETERKNSELEINKRITYVNNLKNEDLISKKVRNRSVQNENDEELGESNIPKVTKTRGLFGWIKLLNSISDNKVKEMAGTDIALYLIWIRYSATFFGIISAINIVTIYLYIGGKPL